MFRDGHSTAEVASATGYTESGIRWIMLRHNLGPLTVPMGDRLDLLEDALAAGLSIHQSLDDAGWTNPAAAMRAYHRAGRKPPKALRTAARKNYQEARA